MLLICNKMKAYFSLLKRSHWKLNTNIAVNILSNIFLHTAWIVENYLSEISSSSALFVFAMCWDPKAQSIIFQLRWTSHTPKIRDWFNSQMFRQHLFKWILLYGSSVFVESALQRIRGDFIKAVMKRVIKILPEKC